MKILDKYIILEMLGPFFFGVATFTILFFAGGQMTVVTRLIAEGGSSIFEALTYAVNTLPAIFVLTFPMAVLLSSLLAFGRLSGESELVALKAGGISFTRTAVPAILMSLVIAVIAFYINNYIAPDSTYYARKIFMNQYVKQNKEILENITIRETQKDGSDMVIFFKRLIANENRMEDVTMQFFKNGRRIKQVFANEAFFRVGIGKWYLKKADINIFDNNQKIIYDAQSNEVLMPLNKSPDQLSKKQIRRHEEMNLQTLKKNIKKLKENYQKLKRENAQPADIIEAKRKWNLFQVSYQEKIAIPFTCLVFALFGIPLGIRPQRTSKAFGLGLSIIFIFVYYVLISAGHTLGEHGHINPVFAAWLPNFLFAIAGVALILKQSRE